VVSSLYHVFNVKIFESIAKFALVAAFCFGLFAGLPLLVHLGQPQRAFNIFFTPHTTSAMSIFGYIYASYMALLMVELWLTYREYYIQRASETKGLISWWWKILALGITEYTPEAARVDHRITIFLAAIGIPWAFTLHGYVGFIFGTVKANAWWATPLQPIIFLMSAIVSGIAMLTLMYTFIRWKTRRPYNFPMLRQLMVILWALFILDFTIEMLEIVYAKYEHGHHWSLIGPLLNGPLFNTYVIGQILICSVIPLILLGYIVVSRAWGKQLLYIANFSSLLIVLQVLLMRYNVVIGGQMISNSDRGFIPFHFEFFAREGLLPTMIILAGPFLLYYFFNQFFPMFDDQPVRQRKP
jgi:Ni/Fe-hydrogenase subunit HybB-like protein